MVSELSPNMFGRMKYVHCTSICINKETYPFISPLSLGLYFEGFKGLLRISSYCQRWKCCPENSLMQLENQQLYTTLYEHSRSGHAENARKKQQSARTGSLSQNVINGVTKQPIGSNRKFICI